MKPRILVIDDEAAIRDYFKDAFDINIQKHHLVYGRSRLGDTAGIETYTPEQLLDMYWATIGLDDEELPAMQALAREVLSETEA